MKRYYLTDIIGDGTDEGGDYRSALTDYPLGVGGEVPWDEASNRPMNGWMLAEVFAGDVSSIAIDPRIDALPPCPLQTPTSQIDPKQFASMRAALTRRGIGIALDAAPTFGDIIAAITLRAGQGTVLPAIAQAVL